MKDTHVLTRHSDIQNWVSTRHGLPAIARIRNQFGLEQSELRLRFSHQRRMQATPSLDDGMSPCSWAAWLAELDRQHLALRVSVTAAHFEFIDRKELH